MLCPSRTWIVSPESDNSPSTRRHADGVALLWIVKIEVFTVPGVIEVAESLGQNVVVESAQVDGVVFRPEESRVL